MKKDILLIACEMIKDEIFFAMERTEISYNTVWMNSELHNNPEFLTIELQKEINNHQDYDMILLAYGCCGNGLVGLVSKTTKLAFLRSEDCIHILLHNNKELKSFQGETYFITKGWMMAKKSLNEEYHYAINKYGPKRAEKIMRIMFKSYQNLVMIDSGAYDLEEFIQCARHLSQVLQLEFMITKGDISLLEMLLSLDWDHHVVEISPGDKISKDDFGVECSISGLECVNKRD
jgi:hypothetical protein